MLISYTQLILLLNLILKKDCKKNLKLANKPSAPARKSFLLKMFCLVHYSQKLLFKLFLPRSRTNRLSSFSINLDQFLVQRDRQGEATLVVTRLPEVGGPAMERRLFREVEANISKVQLVILAITKDWHQ